MFERSIVSASRLLVVATGLTVSAVAAVPAIAATEFQGGGFVTNFTGCDAQGWSGVVRVVSRMQPAGLPENDPTITHLSIVYGTGIHIIDFAGPPSLDWAPVEMWSTWTSVTDYLDGEVAARMLPGSTLSIDNSTQQIVLNAEINGFGGNPGCSALVVVVLNKDARTPSE